MDDNLLLGLWRYLLPVPRAIWQRQVGGRARLEFMTEAHHRIRNYVVSELPRAGKPLAPDLIAGTLNLPLPVVTGLLDDLEKHMTFLVRNAQGAVTWAYPVTVDRTPHQLTFSTGEQVCAA